MNDDTLTLTEKIMAYESGLLTGAAALHLFSELVSNGMAWSLQGSYGRSAASLIEGGMLTKDGAITDLGHTIEDN